MDKYVFLKHSIVVSHIDLFLNNRYRPQNDILKAGVENGWPFTVEVTKQFYRKASSISFTLLNRMFCQNIK